MVVCILCCDSVRGVGGALGRDKRRSEAGRKPGKHRVEKVVRQRVRVLAGCQPLREADNGHSDHADPQDVEGGGRIQLGRELFPLDARANIRFGTRGGGLEELESLEILTELFSIRMPFGPCSPGKRQTRKRRACACLYVTDQ